MIAKTVTSACVITMETLAQNTADIPFALFYWVNKQSNSAELLGASTITLGLDNVSPWSFRLEEPDTNIKCVWPLKNALASLKTIILPINSIKGLPLGAPNQTIREAILLPVKSSIDNQAVGVLIMGVNPARQLDKEYKTFFEFLGGQFARALQNAQNYEDERKQAEKLAEIDRLKTLFFSNVSHEFRTPLTLMLAPLADSLEELKNQNEPLLKAHHDRQMLIQRNALRLLKLVNSLLDFSRIEAGRIDAVYEPTNLTQLTKDLASVFRSLIEKENIAYTQEIENIEDWIYVDKEMWEKIIFNLLSNAFKFTFEGEIKVSLKKEKESIFLSIQDSGVGISESDLPRMFERFYRIESTKGRSYEGSGIGLSLVQELVKLHGGNVEVRSQQGKGTTFIVSIPMGYSHLPQQSVTRKREGYKPAVIGTAFVEEAKRWSANENLMSPSRNYATSSVESSSGPLPKKDTHTKINRILLVDDNADMREYVESILSKYWEVKTVCNGLEAFNAILESTSDNLNTDTIEDKNLNTFDLVLSDVMMPILDGFGLINKIRNNSSIQHLPIILLSAKAGEEAKVEGLSSGANDYLIKPFSAQELIARIHNQLQLAESRKELEKRVEERTQELRQAMEVLRLETLEKIKKENDLVEQKTRLNLSVEYQERLKEFINTICHEIRNPLHVSFGNIDFLIEAVENIEVIYGAIHEKTKSETEALKDLSIIINNFKEYLSRLENSCEQQQKVINEALDYSKVESNKLELHPVVFQVQDFVKDLTDMYSTQLAQKKISLKHIIPAQMVWLKADSFRLKQVISNLMSNAIKFTPPDGTITLKVENQIVSEIQSRLNVSIEDTGMGMTPEELARLFQSFSQANSGVSAQYGGSGLGLAISKKLVEEMGGQIRVESEREKGTVFSFNILCEILNKQELGEMIAQQSDSSISSKQLHKQEFSPQNTSKTVLVVEDDKANRDILCAYLKGAGYNFETAENGQEAVERCSQFSFDLIIMDVVMPLMNGIVATKTLRTKGIITPIIGLSGLGREDQIKKAKEEGFTEYLTKPIRREVLWEMVEKYTSSSLLEVSHKMSDEAPLKPLPYAEVQSRTFFGAATSSASNKNSKEEREPSSEFDYH